jgi:hypoxanthine phosphoribosyltransferase
MVEKRFRKAYKRQLSDLQKASPTATFEMKKVMSPLRGYFRPVIATAGAAAVAGHRILLVDDILGSGTSITSAADALRVFLPLSVAGLTFMGQLRPET